MDMFNDFILSDMMPNYPSSTTSSSSTDWAPSLSPSWSPAHYFDALLRFDNMLGVVSDPAYAIQGDEDISLYSSPSIPSSSPETFPAITFLQPHEADQDGPDLGPPTYVMPRSYAEPKPIPFVARLASEIRDVAAYDGQRPRRRDSLLPQKPPKGGYLYHCDQPNCAFLKPMKRSAWKQHQRVHTGERPYKCTYCGSAFPKVFNLRRHYKTCKGKMARDSGQHTFSDTTSSTNGLQPKR